MGAIQIRGAISREEIFMNIDWNAAEYHSNFSFVYKYGEELTGLFTLKKGSRVADVGCGNGVLTQKLRTMGYDAFGIDNSAEMIALAKRNAPDMHFIRADATQFTLEEPADGIFSNAVFHWIDDHDLLAQNLARNLRTGGELVCEFGGKGCAEAVHGALEDIFAERGLKYRRTFNFKSIGEFAPVLERHGLVPTYCTLFPRPTLQAEGESGLKNWILTFLKEPFAGIEAGEREDIIAEAERRLRPALCKDGQWYIDYMRIRIKAVKVQ